MSSLFTFSKMQSTELTYFIDVPLHSVMRICVQRPSGTSKEEVLESITQDELSLALPVPQWEDIKRSWQIFMNSERALINLTEGNPPMSLLEQALGISFSK